MTTHSRATGEGGERTPASASAPEIQVEEVELSTGDRAVLAFRRDLPVLLKEKPGQWVAYHGDQRVGFARTPIELYQNCLRLGIPEDDFIVRPIEVEPPTEIDFPHPLGSQLPADDWFFQTMREVIEENRRQEDETGK